MISKENSDILKLYSVAGFLENTDNVRHYLMSAVCIAASVDEAIGKGLKIIQEACPNGYNYQVMVLDITEKAKGFVGSPN